MLSYYKKHCAKIYKGKGNIYFKKLVSKFLLFKFSRTNNF
jgi:hypothetical protein